MNALIESEVTHLVKASGDVTINNNTDLAKATAVLKGIKGLKDKVNESFNPIIEKAHQSHKEAIAQRDKYLNPLKAVELNYKDAIVTYNKKVEEETIERLRIANAELEKQAEAARQEALKNAEKLTDEWEQLVAVEKAYAIETLQIDQPKKAIEQEGLSIRKTWKARVVNASLIPKEYWLINESLLNTHAKDENIRKSGIGGIEFYQEQSASVRG